MSQWSTGLDEEMKNPNQYAFFQGSLKVHGSAIAKVPVVGWSQLDADRFFQVEGPARELRPWSKLDPKAVDPLGCGRSKSVYIELLLHGALFIIFGLGLRAMLFSTTFKKMCYWLKKTQKWFRTRFFLLPQIAINYTIVWSMKGSVLGPQSNSEFI